MPDQHSSLNLTPAERRAVWTLMRITREDQRRRVWRDDKGILRARTGRYLYVYNADEGRFNDAGTTDSRIFAAQ